MISLSISGLVIKAIKRSLLSTSPQRRPSSAAELNIPASHLMARRPSMIAEDRTRHVSTDNLTLDRICRPCTFSPSSRSPLALDDKSKNNDSAVPAIELTTMSAADKEEPEQSSNT